MKARKTKAGRAPRGKRRTREHIIADLSANHFERHALLSGHSVERIVHDYGVDLILYTYDRNGEIENGGIPVQLKATDRIRYSKRQKVMRHSVSRSDLKHWLKEPLPVILILYDARKNVAYWQYVQAYFENKTERTVKVAQRSVIVHLPISNILDKDAIQKFVEFKDNVLSQLDRRIRHHV